MKHERVWLVATLLLTSSTAGAIASVVLSPHAHAQTGSNVVTTAQLNLVDRAGRVRGTLSAADERGFASLSLFDEAGTLRAALGVDPDGVPQLQLNDEREEVRVSLTVQRGGPMIVVNDDAGRSGILGTVTGAPVLTFVDGQQGRVQLGLNSEGAAALGMFGEAGQRSASLVVPEDGAAVLTLYDDTGARRATLGVVEGASVLNMADQTRARIVLGVAENGVPSLTFLDQDGKISRTVP